MKYALWKADTCREGCAATGTPVTATVGAWGGQGETSAAVLMLLLRASAEVAAENEEKKCA